MPIRTGWSRHSCPRPTTAPAAACTTATSCVWETCERTLFRFSPDARHLQASDPYLDGLGLSSIGVVDAETGEPLVTYRIDGGFIAHQIWEDDAHLLAVVSAPDGWSILRLGLDGSHERAVGPVPQAEDPTVRQLFLPGSY